MIFHHTPDGPNPICPSLTRTAAEPVQCLGPRCAIWSPRFNLGERIAVPNADKAIYVLKPVGECGTVTHTEGADEDSVRRGLILRADVLARLGAVRVTPRSIVTPPPAAQRPNPAARAPDGPKNPANPQPVTQAYDPGDDPI